MCRFPPKKLRTVERINRAVRLALQEGNNASVPLRAILRGHSLDFRFRVLSSSFRAACKHMRVHNLRVPCHWHSKGWPQVLQACMLECGWVLESPWKWKHEVLSFRVSLDWAAAPGNADRGLPFLRGAWRWSLFRAFRPEDRRDSAMFRRLLQV